MPGLVITCFCSITAQLWIIIEAKFCKAMVITVLHHFYVPSQNYVNVNNPIKMMANFEMNFPTSLLKTLINFLLNENKNN